jgi:hypothetical protein
VPEYLFGEPIYDKGHCIAYLISKLEENGFTIQYLHPNTLFVTWEHWVPSYLRNEVKKKTGITIDEKGNVVKKKGDEGFVEEMPPEQRNKTESNKNIYNPIKSYKPSGNLVYDKELFEKIEKKVTFV